jgi:anthranilate phosphoribosyltransferase
VHDGAVTERMIDAVDLGLPRSVPADLRGGDARYNAAVARAFLAGERGPVRDAVLLNAGAALAAYDGLGGDLTRALATGLERAAKAVDSGAAATLLERWVTTAHAAR